MRTAFTTLGEHDEKMSFRIPRRAGEDNIKTNLKQIRYSGMDWIHVTKNGTKPCEIGNWSSCSIKCGKFLGQLSDYQLLNKSSAPRS
jgi:hypothetical protein